MILGDAKKEGGMAKREVLIVDDDPAVLELMTELLAAVAEAMTSPG